MDPELHLATMSHYGLEAVLRVQVPPLHKTVFGAMKKTEPCCYNPEEEFLNFYFGAVLPGDQEVLVSEEQGLRDEVFMASQPVQSTFVDDVPHDNICVLKQGHI